MSYDVIETLVAESKKKMQPASIIPMENDVQFQRVLPLEMPTVVEPLFCELKRYVGNFRRCAERIQDDFVLCGYYLNHIKRNGLYRYCIEEGLQGYTNFYKFCEDVLGVATTTAKRLISINEHFCKNQPKIPDTYKRFGASKLAIMATFKNGLEEKMRPAVTTRQLEKLQKYYSARDWNVNLDTTYIDDLKQYEKMQEENRLAKSRRLKEKTFEPVETETKTKGYVSDSYKAYTKFFDETLQRVATLNASKDKRFAAIVQELETVLKKLQNDVLKMQANEMLDGL